MDYHQSPSELKHAVLYGRGTGMTRRPSSLLGVCRKPKIGLDLVITKRTSQKFDICMQSAIQIKSDKMTFTLLVFSVQIKNILKVLKHSLTYRF